MYISESDIYNIYNILQPVDYTSVLPTNQSPSPHLSETLSVDPTMKHQRMRCQNPFFFLPKSKYPVQMLSLS